MQVKLSEIVMFQSPFVGGLQPCGIFNKFLIQPNASIA